MPTFLERYRAGQHEPVWAELRALGGAIRHEPHRDDAWAVARATMERAGENIRRLVAGLHRLGYQFDFPDEILTPPGTGLIDPVDWLDSHGGPLPLSLRAWYEVVGGVNFMGHHADWPTGAADPLVVFSVELAAQEYQDWRRWRDEEGGDVAGPLAITLAPDALQKAGDDSPGSYRMLLPDAGADGLLLGAWPATTFVDYLRLCCRWGGFPGLARLPGPPPARLLALAGDLLPF